MRLLTLCATVGFAAAFATGCAKDVCDRSAAFDPASKKGNCDVAVPARILPQDGCAAALAECTDDDRAALDSLMECQEALPVCASGDAEAWVTAHEGCYERVAGISESCRTAMFEGGLPGADAGVEDAGVDAGVQPDPEGALDLFGTADETTVALAWTRSQRGEVSRWEVYAHNEVDLPLPMLTVETDAQTRVEDTAEPMERRKYFVAGFNEAGEVVTGQTGEADAGMDAGMAMCMSPFDCPVNRVCNLGQCVETTCMSSDDCPGGYLCHANSGLCERVILPDAGTADAGMTDAGMEITPRPFISEQIEVTTGVPQYSQDRLVSGFAANSPSMVAIDTARAFVIMEQESQIFGYHTEDRGKTFQPVAVDSTGRYPRLAYEPQSKTLFACYTITIGAGNIRVRASEDEGRTWKQASLELINPMPEDGGFAESILDCAISRWQDGMAIVAAVEGGTKVNVWTVNKDLQIVSGPDRVFENSGVLSSPGQLALATLPEEFQVHLLMTVTRAGVSPKSKVIGFYRDQTTSGAFVGPNFVGLEGAVPNYSNAAVAIDPVTKRGIAAFVSDEGSGGFPGTTVYAALFRSDTKKWVTGSDLNVFFRNMSGPFLVFPERQASQAWSALAPGLAVDKKGRVTLAMLAGQSTSGILNLNVYAVPFDFEKLSPGAANAKGWFGTPCTMSPCEVEANAATRVSSTRAAKLEGRTTAGPVVTADQQISTWIAFIEGVGATGDAPNRPVVISRPR